MIDEPLALLAEAFGGDPEPVLPDPVQALQEIPQALPEIPAVGVTMQAPPVGTASTGVRNAA